VRNSYTPPKMALSRYRPGSYKPSLKLGAGQDAPSDTMGLSILAALSIAGIHSALSPSLFTYMAFAQNEEAKARAMKTLWISLGASSVGALGIWLVFNQMVPALVAEATAVALFGAGIWAINHEPPKTIPLIEKQ
jgi:tellurite resistance protein TehA-like permease